MKKLLYISLYLLSATIFSVSAQQQIDPGGLTPLKATKLFRFISAKESINQKVLFHNRITNAVELKIMSSEVFNSTNGYLESFIIQSADDNGNVFIISAKSPNYYLKRTSNNMNSSVRFANKETVNNSLYIWQISVGNNTGEVISFQVPGVRHLGLSVTESGDFIQKYFTDLSGASLNGLSSQSLDPMFLFKMQSITNVF